MQVIKSSIKFYVPDSAGTIHQNLLLLVVLLNHCHGVSGELLERSELWPYTPLKVAHLPLVVVSHVHHHHVLLVVQHRVPLGRGEVVPIRGGVRFEALVHAFQELAISNPVCRVT